MSNMLRVLARFFEKRGTRCRLNKNKDVLRFKMRGANGFWNCYGTQDSKTGLLLFRSIYPLRIPRRYLREAAVFVAGLNHDQSIVCFGIDWRTRTLSCRTSVSSDMHDRRVLLEDVALSNILAMDTHLLIIRDVLRGAITARRGLSEARALRNRA